MLDCPTCGTPLPDEARFCAECGRAVPGRGGVLDEPLVTLPSPGLWPPDPVAVVAVLVAAGGVILAIGGEWGWAAVAFLAAALTVVSRALNADRRRRWMLAELRARAAATREAMAARSREQVELFRARRELAELEAERVRLFRDFGYSVYVSDEAGMEATRAALDEVIERVARKETEIGALRRQTEERIERAQADVRPTVRLETPPEPARVPEPWPPPDEGDLPDPAPTPSPAPTPEEPPAPVHPPPPQTGERRAM